MHKFEVPYNFEPDYLPYLEQNKDLLPWVKFIYMASWKEDGINTRKNTILEKYYPKTWQGYLYHLRILQRYADVCILIQKNSTIDIVDKYYNLGIRYFILNDDSLAKQLKYTYADIHITLSVTRWSTKALLEKLECDLYDNIVLPFIYNRHIDYIKQLPIQHKYVILVNNECYYNCDHHDIHWYLQADTIEEFCEKEDKLCYSYCKEIRKKEQNRTFVNPEDLQYFDPYISSYKLVDRTAPSQFIFNDLRAFALRKNNLVLAMHNDIGEAFYNVED